MPRQLAIANAQLRDELHEQSTQDPLTGLFNRRYFLERCRPELNRATQNSDEFGIAVFDADHFNMFNDHYGYDTGVYRCIGEISLIYPDIIDKMNCTGDSSK